MIRIVFRFQGKRAMAYDFNTEIGECNKKIKVQLYLNGIVLLFFKLANPTF